MNDNIVRLKRNIVEDYAYSEAIKGLRTNVQYCGSNIHVIMFTSALPDEGKSDICFGLASSMARIGKKVVVVDADIRRSVIKDRYNVKGEISGLTHYLTGQKGAGDIVYETSRENLSVVFAGPFSPNPSELLEDSLFDDFIEYLRVCYDYVFIDTPPMASLADGSIVGRRCDGAIMVIESGAISYRLEQQVMKQIETSGTKVLGAVLNRVDPKAEAYYGKYGKYGKYGRYGGYGKYGEYGAYGYGSDVQEKMLDEKLSLEEEEQRRQTESGRAGSDPVQDTETGSKEKSGQKSEDDSVNGKDMYEKKSQD